MLLQNWINMILGALVVGVAFFDITGTTLTWTLGALGVAIIAIEIWEASSVSALTEKRSML